MADLNGETWLEITDLTKEVIKTIESAINLTGVIGNVAITFKRPTGVQ